VANECKNVHVHDDQSLALALMILRCGVAIVMIAHGYNHVFGTGKITGTAQWFDSMGMRPPRLQAWLASLTEIGAGTLLAIGFLTPFAAAGVVGVMSVAWAINHRGNGFFIFRPGEGWEYVMTLGVVGVSVATLGAGDWSLDRMIGIDDELRGWVGLTIGLSGVAAAAVILAACWRPPSKPIDSA
jgi:putative oxidoreductase